jgi:hypothetical protein
MCPDKINIQAVRDSIANSHIKVRCWDKITNKMFFPTMINKYGEVRHTFADNQETWLLKDSFDTMLYCCKDKNGQDVYAGDIVLKHDGKTKAVVYYDYDVHRFCLTPWWYGEAEDGWHPNQIEKIGNIYENLSLISEDIA